MTDSLETFEYRGETFFLRKVPKKRNTVQTPHFRLKQGRLYFCLGGQTVAAWPAKGEAMYLVLIQAKMFLSKEPGDFRLSRDQRKIRRLAVMLHKALLRTEETRAIARSLGNASDWRTGCSTNLPSGK